jgi:predicted ribonuclease YlaK
MATRKNGKTQPSTSSKIKGRNPIFENFYFEPKTQTQAEAIIDFDSGKNLILSGFAGTGKTMIALALALRELAENRVRKICIFRSSVSSRDIGFLPGTEEEKMEVYEKAVKFLTNKLLRRDDA